MHTILSPFGTTICFAVMNLCAWSQPPGDTPEDFDIGSFALPNCEAGEIRFEEPRDIRQIVLTFPGAAPERLSVSYLHKGWPDNRIEHYPLPDHAMHMGWYPLDDQFNSVWKEAAIDVAKLDRKTLQVTFQPLDTEFPGVDDYKVGFRRTLGLRVNASPAPVMEEIRVYTASEPATSTLRVELDAGKPTESMRLALSAYNATVDRIMPGSGVTLTGDSLTLARDGRRVFNVELRHMKPAHRFCNDQGNLTFELDHEIFTISLESLANQGPVWFEDQGVYITDAGDETDFAEYLARHEGNRTLASQVLDSREQSLGGAMTGQPRPHAVAFHLACKRARQRFWLEANGDLVMHHFNVGMVEGRDTPHFKNDGNGRFFFGLERWNVMGRYPDATQLAEYTTLLRNGDLELELKALAAPLSPPAEGGELTGDATIVALLRFRFRNAGAVPLMAELPIAYSPESGRSINRREAGGHFGRALDDNLVPFARMEALAVAPYPGDAATRRIDGQWHGEAVLRATVTDGMTLLEKDDRIVLRRELAPGESCEAVLKVPYIALESPEDLEKLAGLDFAACESGNEAFWRDELQRGAQIHTPEPRLNKWHSAHLGHVLITDMAMPGDPGLINTSVGTSTYPNYSNESCMIIEDLEERGLHEEARRRLGIWLKYQGTKELKGNFTDQEGVFFGCGGYEGGETYDQHHGWIMWCMAKHYFATGDMAWLNDNADSLIEGAEWVFRQRRNTMKPLAHSRGWEYGFLPAGSLEDVSDYFYWLSTNTMTWRGVDWVARALDDAGHPQAAKIRAEADAYRQDLINGFEMARRYSPLVKLRDGRWVPHYPSRLYLRGRDVGWIRELLEGSVYLLISGLYDPAGKQAGWILDDYQDNRYCNPVYGYPINDFDTNWFDLGGFSCQPALLAGLMPCLDRDEPEVYIWMFFNAWAACYREDIGAMSEHPVPILGFSNSAGIKTSDQSNASKWLRYMFVYAAGDTLFLGRAIPREWFGSGQDLSLTGAGTAFGKVSVEYRPALEENKIILTADLNLTRSPERILARFRHPENLPVKSVIVNGKDSVKFDAGKGDVDLSGMSGRVTVEARY